jgi:peptide/nickel transport system ATP-binding protein
LATAVVDLRDRREADVDVGVDADSQGPPAPRGRVVDLAVTFTRRGVPLRALRGVSLDIAAGEILAVVGESGSGKSVLGLSLLGLLRGDPEPTVTGRAEVCGVDMVSALPDQRRALRRAKLGAVFQDPMTSLNPTMRVGRQVSRAAGSSAEALRLLDLVGIPDPAGRMRAYPHELSGGLRQRVMMAMAVAGAPALVVADEPTTALDVTVQAQILRLLRDLRDEIGCSFVLVTHDIGVASQVADRVAVLYGGRIAELGRMHDVLAEPSHPYTAGLLRSRLSLDLPRGHEIATLPGEPPDPRTYTAGCAFAARCPSKLDRCEAELPELAAAPTHDGEVACFGPPPAVPSIEREATARFPPAAIPQSPRRAVHCDGVGKFFSVRRGVMQRDRLAALRNVTLEVMAGESVAIVGESGSGKSTLLRVIAGLLDPDEGTITRADKRPQMVFQDAGASLTPWLTVGEIVGDRLRGSTTREERRRRVEAALALVGLPGEVAGTKAGLLSGGQRQRVAFARSTIVAPELLLCDEPTSALDASLAAAVLNLLQHLRLELGMAVMFVTHDLGAARFVADRVAVMYLGEVVEFGPAESVVGSPSHPYTKALLSAVPRADTRPVRLQGEPASPLAIPTGCAFHPRCAERIDGCDSFKPELQAVELSTRHEAACVHVGEHTGALAAGVG